MRERAEQIGAGFKIRSRAGAGTEIELTVPERSRSTAPGHGLDGATRRSDDADDGRRTTMSDQTQIRVSQRRRPSAAAGRHRRGHQQPAGHADGGAGLDRP